MTMKLFALLASAAFCPEVPALSTITSAYEDDDVGSLDVAGYRPNPFARRGGGARPQPQARGWVPPREAPQAARRLQPLGLTAVAFTAASGLGLNMTALPQRPFQAKRLLIDLSRSGATSTGLVTVTSINMGSDNQLVGGNPLPVSGFGATAFDLNIDFEPVVPGIQVVVGVACSLAPTNPDRIDLAGGFWGTSLSTANGFR